MEFNAGNKVMREECRLEVADLIEQTRADINVDPLLQKACAVDVSKYCSDIPQGAGRREWDKTIRGKLEELLQRYSLIETVNFSDIMCLQNVLQDKNKSLEPDCYKMLTTRMEMFRNAAKVLLSYYYL